MKRILLILVLVGLTGLLVGCPPVPDPDLAPPAVEHMPVTLPEIGSS